MVREFPRLRRPIVQAPMAGGPSTPALAAAVSGAGGLGFLAAGYLTTDRVRDQIVEVRRQTEEPFGVNVFMLARRPVDEAALSRYADEIAVEANRRGAALGESRFEDDHLEAKLDLLCDERPAVVSFTFACPPAETVARLHAAEIAVWLTITEPDEAVAAAAVGADALIVQGVEAGGHRGSFEDRDGYGELSLTALLRLTRHVTELPLIASGGIADGAGVAAALAAGALAVQIGTAFMLCPEAGTNPAQREALATSRETRLTRAFTGRRARGIVNQFMRDHDSGAPSAYPHVHHLTSPLRAAARAAGDADGFNLWAGEAHVLAEEAPAAALVERWSRDADAALEQARRVLDNQ